MTYSKPEQSEMIYWLDVIVAK